MPQRTSAWISTPTTCVRQRTTLFGHSVCSSHHRRSEGLTFNKVRSSSTKHSEIKWGEIRMSSSNVEEEWNGEKIKSEELLSKIKFNKDGLIAAIAQQYDTNEVLMMAWMNEESIKETLKQGRIVYYSRSRKELWRKGDTSGQVQYLKDFILDCDGDTLLLKVNQMGVACHTGRKSCFYTAFRPPFGNSQIIHDVLMDPKKLYGSNTTSNRKLFS